MAKCLLLLIGRHYQASVLGLLFRVVSRGVGCLLLADPRLQGCDFECQQMGIQIMKFFV